LAPEAARFVRDVREIPMVSVYLGLSGGLNERTSRSAMIFLITQQRKRGTKNWGMQFKLPAVFGIPYSPVEFSWHLHRGS